MEEDKVNLIYKLKDIYIDPTLSTDLLNKIFSHFNIKWGNGEDILIDKKMSGSIVLRSRNGNILLYRNMNYVGEDIKKLIYFGEIEEDES